MGIKGINLKLKVIGAGTNFLGEEVTKVFSYQQGRWVGLSGTDMPGSMLVGVATPKTREEDGTWTDGEPIPLTISNSVVPLPEGYYAFSGESVPRPRKGAGVKECIW